MPGPYDDLKRQFHKATVQDFARHKPNNQEWRRHKELTQRFDQIRTKTEKLYKEHYQIRVDQEHRRLLRDRTSPQRHLRYAKWMGYDQLSPSALRAQAQVNVRNRHTARIASLDKREKEAVRELTKQVKTRQQQKGKPTKAFNRATDRRTGTDRRRGDDRRHADSNDRSDKDRTRVSRRRSDTKPSQPRQSHSTRPTRSFQRRR